MLLEQLKLVESWVELVVENVVVVDDEDEELEVIKELVLVFVVEVDVPMTK